jgi:hypothetical protein
MKGTIAMSDATVSRKRISKKAGALLLGLGLLASSLPLLASSGALSGFTASINNTVNNVGSGTLLMTETQGATTCLSSAAGTVTVANAGTCATINKFGGSTTLVPGVPVTSTVTILNNGTVAANSFTLTPAACVTTNNGAINGTDAAGFCGKVDITIADTTSGTCVAPALASACPALASTTTLASLGTTVINLAVPLAPGASRVYTFNLQLDNSATNAHQGLLASKALLWSFAS